MEIWGSFIIKKYLILTLLILGIIFSLGICDVPASDIGTGNNVNINLNHNKTISKVNHTNLNNINPKTTSKTVLPPRKVIKVVIYNGKGTIKSCVDGVKKCLYISNTKNLVNGYYFSYSTTKTISYSTLSHYNVLVMPGGYSGKDYIKYVNMSGIQKFVKNGHGYLGICAGAYAGSKNVDGMYRGWGFAPNVYSKHPYYEGNLQIKILDPGIKLFRSNNTIPMAYYNGPAMYVKGGKAVTFAMYADNNIGYQNYIAIVGDYYYKGRAILSGVHPELDPQHPNILAGLIAWAAKITVNNNLIIKMSSPYNRAVDISPNNVIKVTFNKPIKFGNKKITLKSSKGKSIPLTLIINNNILILNHNLLSKGDKYIITIASGSVTDLSGKACSLYTTSFTVSSLTMTQMTDGISRIQKFYTKNNRLPAYVIFGNKKILIKNFKAIIETYGLKINY